MYKNVPMYLIKIKMKDGNIKWFQEGIGLVYCFGLGSKYQTREEAEKAIQKSKKLSDLYLVGMKARVVKLPILQEVPNKSKGVRT